MTGTDKATAKIQGAEDKVTEFRSDYSAAKITLTADDQASPVMSAAMTKIQQLQALLGMQGVTGSIPIPQPIQQTLPSFAQPAPAAKPAQQPAKSTTSSLFAPDTTSLLKPSSGALDAAAKAKTGFDNWISQSASWLIPAATIAVAPLTDGLSLGALPEELGAEASGEAASNIVDFSAAKAAKQAAQKSVQDVADELKKVAGFANGGIVSSPQFAMIGESGPEAVIPLNQLNGVMNNASRASGNASGNAGQQMIDVTLKLDGRTLARVMRPYNVNESDRVGFVQGYDPGYNYPK